MGNRFITGMEYNDNLTENEMPTHSTSGDKVFDLFIASGASRQKGIEDIRWEVEQAWQVDKEKTLKVLFYARDIDEGNGERRYFREALKYLLSKGSHTEEIIANLTKPENLVADIVRVDDLVYLATCLIGQRLTRNANIDKIISFLFLMLENKKNGNIVAKWMPRKNSQNQRLVKYMRVNGQIETYSAYRRLITSKTEVVEQKMSKNEWENINLEQVPSIAMKQYKRAFQRHSILQPFLDKVKAGEAKINAKRLTPFDIIHDLLINRNNNGLLRLADLQWQNLKELNDLPAEYRALPIIDVSRSMTMPDFIPISMALGLGMFLAERNPNQVFRDYFITFSGKPQFQKIEGWNMYYKIINALRANWNNTTNLEATFKLILKKATKNQVPAEEMPTHLIIFSDMEFNYCVKNPEENAYQMIRSMYKAAGYQVPEIVFWNVDASGENFPVKFDESGALLLSGSSQNVMNIVLKQVYENPVALMDEALSKDRYSHISLA